MDAEKLLAEAIQNEPQITTDLKEVAVEVSAEMVGLKNKFKTEESLSEKLAKISVKNVKKLTELNFSIEDAVENVLSYRAEKFNDALRYTFVLSDERYVFAFKKFVSLLKQRGYKVPRERIWNAWKIVKPAKKRNPKKKLKLTSSHHFLETQNPAIQSQSSTRMKQRKKAENP